ncbi:MAG: ATP-binding cassette domain-containing protein [Cellulomonadaceae bacterium]|jgi:macrolide transport system ATP-binding/permease protein|nr:ATP-binding cassette domain-containing protein [Cellulomonadaceae bacterium]
MRDDMTRNGAGATVTAGAGTRRPVGLAGGETTVSAPKEASAEVLSGVNMRMTRGTRVGIVGENGCGKSTLLAVLAGVLNPTRGTITRHGTVTFLSQEDVAMPDETVGDLIATARAAHDSAAPQFDIHDDPAWIVDVALTRLGACKDPERRLATLSVGERYRVRLACALAERADLLLLDEPTNHLDDSAVQFLTLELQQWPGGVALVTHDRQLLDDVATAILDLDPSADGRPTLYGSAGYEGYRVAKERAVTRWKQQFAAERKRAEALAEVMDASYEGLSDEWRPPKGSQKHRRGTRARIHVKAADRRVRELQASAVNVPEPPLELAFPPLPEVPDGPVVPDGHESLITVTSPVVGRRLSLEGETVRIPPGDRLLVLGPNGSGKSTLLRVIAGTIPLTRGSRTEMPGLRIGVVAQENPALTQEQQTRTGFDIIAEDVLRLLSRGALDPTRVIPLASLGLLSEKALDQPLGELSVGQRRRFEVARALVPAPHLLIFDEPTNHLSVDLVEQLTPALRSTRASIVVATHDRRLRADLADWPTLALK